MRIPLIIPRTTISVASNAHPASADLRNSNTAQSTAVLSGFPNLNEEVEEELPLIHGIKMEMLCLSFCPRMSRRYYFSPPHNNRMLILLSYHSVISFLSLWSCCNKKAHFLLIPNMYFAKQSVSLLYYNSY